MLKGNKIVCSHCEVILLTTAYYALTLSFLVRECAHSLQTSIITRYLLMFYRDTKIRQELTIKNQLFMDAVDNWFITTDQLQVKKLSMTNIILTIHKCCCLGRLGVHNLLPMLSKEPLLPSPSAKRLAPDTDSLARTGIPEGWREIVNEQI